MRQRWLGRVHEQRQWGFLRERKQQRYPSVERRERGFPGEQWREHFGRQRRELLGKQRQQPEPEELRLGQWRQSRPEGRRGAQGRQEVKLAQERPEGSNDRPAPTFVENL